MTVDEPHSPADPLEDFDAEFDDELLERIKGELDPGESVVWAARPIPRDFRTGSRKLLPWIFELIAVALTLFSAFAAYRFRARDPGGPIVLTVVAGAVSVLIPMAVIGGAKARKKAARDFARSTYVLTGRRVIVWQVFPTYYPTTGTITPRRDGLHVASYPRASIRGVSRVEYDDGSGDVVIRRGLGEGELTTCSISGVADVRRVERLFREVLLGGGHGDGGTSPTERSLTRSFDETGE